MAKEISSAPWAEMMENNISFMMENNVRGVALWVVLADGHSRRAYWNLTPIELAGIAHIMLKDADTVAEESEEDDDDDA